MGLKQFELKGKVAMVTGSTRGLGEVSALALAKAGADIAVCGRSTPDLERVTAAIRGLGQNADGFHIDVTDKTKVFEAVAQVLDYFGRIDILVNNAGVNYRVPVLEFPEEEWDRIISTNLKGYFLTAQAVAPQMINNGYGKIINMSSVLGTVGLPNQVAYASSKGRRRSDDQGDGPGMGQTRCARKRRRADLFRNRIGHPDPRRPAKI